jgi:preprotein translocase subunit SecG
MVAACPLACRRGIIPSTPIKHKGDIIVAVSVNLVQIIISIALIVIVLLQAKGSGLGGIFGGDSSIYKTRRGVEKTLFQATIGIVIAFFAIAIISVLLTG